MNLSPFATEGAGNAGRRCARSRACSVGNTRVSHHGHTGITRHSPRNGFNGFLRALPGDQACLTPSPARLLADLTPTMGRQNDTTSPSASARFVKRAARVHRIPPRVDDVAQRPSEGRDRIAILLILPGRQAKFRKIRNWSYQGESGHGTTNPFR